MPGILRRGREAGDFASNGKFSMGDTSANCDIGVIMKFKRYEGNPIIPRRPGTFYSLYSANPDVLFFRGKYHFYFRGQGEAGHDQIGVAYSAVEDFDGIRWEMYPGNPVLRVSEEAADFDSGSVLDPATVEFDRRVYLYYTAYSLDRDNGPSTGLVISEDGTNFEKAFAGPVAPGIAPEAVVQDGRVYLFRSRMTPEGFFQIHCSISEDGKGFSGSFDPVVLEPSFEEGAFDRFSVTTARIWCDHDRYFMTYAGCDRFPDYPCGIGLARSKDLLNWEKYPDNPIFGRGDPGTWDEGALWFATVHKVAGTYYMWYEGGGSGMGLHTPEGRAASRLSREENYGGYGTTSYSQIGVATWSGQMPDW